MSGCFNSEIERREPNPTGLTGEALFGKLLLFQEKVGVPTSEYYGGVSFDGYEAYLGNLVVYVIGGQNVQVTRDALLETFGPDGDEVQIQVWTSKPTIADDETRREFTRTVWGDGVVSAAHDPRTDRLVVGLESVDVVTKYESLILSELGLPREAFSLYMAIPPELGV